MGRQPCCDKVGLKKGPWTVEEDKKLINFILTNGHCCWRAVPKLAGPLSLPSPSSFSLSISIPPSIYLDLRRKTSGTAWDRKHMPIS